MGLKLERTKQQNLVITSADEPEIAVDNIEVAQFLYLLLHNEKIRDVIDTITSKAVLILGRFTQERKPVLEALREEYRRSAFLLISNTASIGPSETMLLWRLRDGAYKLEALPPSRNTALGQFRPSRNRRAKASNDTSP